MTRVLVGVKTNRGLMWVVPIVEDLVRSGCRVQCCLADEDGPMEDRLRAVGADVVRTPTLGGKGLGAALRGLPGLVRLVRAFRPDVVHYHLYRAALVFRLVSLAAPRARRIHAVPGPLFLEQPILRVVERVLAHRDDVIICTSQVTRRLYRELGIGEDHLPLVAYPVDVDAYVPPSRTERAEARRDLGLERSAFVVVMVAYFYPPRPLVLGGAAVKGHDTVFAAWAEFRRRGGCGTLVVVGGGFGARGTAYRNALLAEAGVADDPTIIAVDSVQDVRPYYAAADVSVAPSRSENLGSAVEASALGVPTIASDVGGLPDLVVANLTGWLVPPADPLALADAFDVCAALVRERRIGRFGEAARERVVQMCGSRFVLPIWTSIVLGHGPPVAAGDERIGRRQV